MRKRLGGDNTMRLRPVLWGMLLLALVLTLHQFVMATPVHVRVMPMVATGPMGQSAASTAPMRGMCDHCPVSTATICPAVQAVFPAVIAALALLAALFLFRSFATTVSGSRTFVQAVWHPPPKDTLVRFQIRRC